MCPYIFGKGTFKFPFPKKVNQEKEKKKWEYTNCPKSTDRIRIEE